MKIQFVGEFPQELSQYENSFNYTEPQDRKLWTYTYGNKSSDLHKFSEVVPDSIEEAMGIASQPRAVQNQTPLYSTICELSQIVNGKHCVFYTGAGLSASVVPTMSILEEQMKLMHIKKKENLFLVSHNALNDSANYMKPMEEFYKTCLYGEPTPAHLEIRNIVIKMNWGLLTENLDLLHQRSGIEPLNRSMPDWLKSNVTKNDLKKIDYVITVGLAKDESGFLGWYKEHNPKGTIVAINLTQPEYLGNEDILIEEDAQSALPKLNEVLLKS